MSGEYQSELDSVGRGTCSELNIGGRETFLAFFPTVSKQIISFNFLGVIRRKAQG